MRPKLAVCRSSGQLLLGRGCLVVHLLQRAGPLGHLLVVLENPVGAAGEVLCVIKWQNLPEECLLPGIAAGTSERS